MAARVEREDFIGASGARLALYRAGAPGGVPMVLANGLGGNIAAFQSFIDHFAPLCDIASWDYAGLYESERASEGTGTTVAEHTADLVALLDHVGMERAIVVGWSMGVQVGLELHRGSADRVLAFVAINGAPGHPFRTSIASRFLETSLPLLAGTWKRHGGKAGWVAPMAANSRVLFGALKAMGFVGNTADSDIFFRLMREFAYLDFGHYLDLLGALGAHDATDLLARVTAPTLVIAGERDLFTPVVTARKMTEHIAAAELYVVPSATHYCPIEFAELVHLRTEKFLRERGALPAR
jgi:pimeloyl-ACP methyl ester carboxylesterase